MAHPIIWPPSHTQPPDRPGPLAVKRFPHMHITCSLQHCFANQFQRVFELNQPPTHPPASLPHSCDLIDFLRDARQLEPCRAPFTKWWPDLDLNIWLFHCPSLASPSKVFILLHRSDSLLWRWLPHPLAAILSISLDRSCCSCRTSTPWWQWWAASATAPSPVSKTRRPTSARRPIRCHSCSFQPALIYFGHLEPDAFRQIQCLTHACALSSQVILSLDSVIDMSSVWVAKLLFLCTFLPRCDFLKLWIWAIWL